jgi:hypothetical protein
VLSALFAADRFPQTLNPHNGEAGFTEKYSPSILCLLDFVERLSGILPRPDGEIWFTGLLPKPALHRYELWETAYARNLHGAQFELLNLEDRSEIYRDGKLICRFPTGLRIVLDPAGVLIAIVGMTSRTVRDRIEWMGRGFDVSVGPNQRWHITGKEPTLHANPGLVLPSPG